MRFGRFSILALLGCVTTACGNSPGVTSTTVSPSLPVSSVPQLPGSQQVTVTLVGGNGPAECPAGARVGQTAIYTLAIDSVGPSVQVLLDPHNYPTDHWADYKGSIVGTQISASGRYYGYDLCGGGNVVGLINYGAPATLTATVEGGRLVGHETRIGTVGSTSFIYEYDWRGSLE